MSKKLQKLLKTTETGIKKLANKISQIAEVIKEDAVYGFRIGRLKQKEVKLEREKAARIYAIGRRTYYLYKQGLITDEETKLLCEKLSKLEEMARKYHGTTKK